MAKLKRILFDKTDKEFEKLIKMRISENPDKNEIAKQEARVEILFDILVERELYEKYRNERFEDISQNG